MPGVVEMPSYSEIKEQDYPLGKLTPDQERVIAARNNIIYENDSRYWSPHLDLGRTCFNYVDGKMFSPAEKADYKKKGKYEITNPELVPKLNALEAMQIAGRKSGVIIPEGTEDSPDAETINRILHSIYSETGYQRESTSSFTDAMISSYPTVMWFEKGKDWAKNRSIDIFHPAWDSVLPDPNFKRSDYYDGQRITRLVLYNKDNLKQDYPRRAKLIDSHIHNSQFEAGSFGNTTFTSAQRDSLYHKAKIASQNYDDTGQILVIERCHFVIIKATVFISPKNEQPELLPADWSQEEIQKWQQVNPDYQPVERMVRVLWVTTSTSTGILLENNRHWYQESEFPCEIYIPKMLNNKPHGMVEYLLGSLKGKNVARIEHLHSLRLANDNVWKVKSGAVENAKELPAEIAKSGGVIVINEEGEMSDVEAVQNRREQVGWADAAEQFQGDMDRIFMDRNVEGGSQSSQESGKAIQKRINQGQMKQSPYLETWNGFDLRCVKKILKMIPYVFTEHHIFRYVDEKTNEPGSTEVNVPQQYDWQTGAVVRVKNNLSGAKYDYREAHGDNSVTGKEYELKVFTEVLHNILPNMPDPSLWPSLLLSIPNRLSNEFGRKIQEQMKAKSDQGPEPPKLSFSFKGEDLLYNPMATTILQQAGYKVQEPPSGQAPQQQAQPSQQTAPKVQVA